VEAAASDNPSYTKPNVPQSLCKMGRVLTYRRLRSLCAVLMIQDYTTRENGVLEQAEGWMVTKSIAHEKELLSDR
jgi:hypothetical protein